MAVRKTAEFFPFILFPKEKRHIQQLAKNQQRPTKGDDVVKDGNLITAWCLSDGLGGTEHAARSHVSALAVTLASAIKPTNCGVNKGNRRFVLLYGTQLDMKLIMSLWPDWVCLICCLSAAPVAR